jgi:hypothetical protein
MAETQPIYLNNNSYDIVSKNLTISEAQMSDQGIYDCNVIDGVHNILCREKDRCLWFV